MKTKYDAYNSWVSFFIVTCETLITGGFAYSGGYPFSISGDIRSVPS